MSTFHFSTYMAVVGFEIKFCIEGVVMNTCFHIKKEYGIQVKCTFLIVLFLKVVYSLKL